MKIPLVVQGLAILWAFGCFAVPAVAQIGHDRTNIPPPSNPRTPPGHERANVAPIVALRVTVENESPLEGGNLVGLPLAQQRVTSALRSGGFATPQGEPLDIEIQQDLLRLMNDAAAETSPQLVRALSSGNAKGAHKSATVLVSRLRGLLEPDPDLRPAVSAYNSLVRKSSLQFLRNPPVEFLMVQSVLAELITGAELYAAW